MTKVRYNEDDIGSEILYSLSKGLYSEPYHVIREYLQNAVDSFPTTIDMTIQNNSIFFYDNGDGMDYHDIDTCRKVGISEKDPDIQVGFRGIGIWAGLIYAKSLKVISSKKNVDKKYILTIDFEKISNGVKEEKILTNLLSQYVDLTEENEDPNEHYTFVELYNITDIGKKLVTNNKNLKEYIAKTLPVNFPDTFCYKKQINDLLKANVPDYRKVEINFQGAPIYKPYPDDSTDTKLLPPAELIIMNNNAKQIGYLWSCLKHKKIRSHGGLVYKIKGFTVGDQQKTRQQLWTSKDHVHWWYFGEIHITDTGVTPNTSREDLEPSDPQREFIKAAKKGISQLKIKAENLSKKISAEEKIKEIEGFLKKIKPQISKIKDLPLIDLIEVQNNTNDSIEELEYRKNDIDNLPKLERKKLDNKIEENLRFLKEYCKKIKEEIERRDKKTDDPKEIISEIKETITKIDLKNTNIEKLSLDDLKDFNGEITKNVGDLEESKERLKKLPQKEKKELEQDILNKIKELNEFEKSLKEIINKKEDEEKEAKEKKRKEQLKKLSQSFNDISRLDKQSQTILELIIEVLAEKLEYDLLEEVILDLKEEIKEKI